MKRFFIFLLLVLLLGCAPQQILTPYDRTAFSEGEFKWITDKDMALQVKDPTHDVQTWWVDATLDDGTFLGIDLSLGKPVKGADGKPLIHVNVIRPNKEPINIWEFYTRAEDFWASRDCLDVRVGQSRLWGTYPDFHLDVSIKGFACSLTLHAQFPSGMLESNEVWFGDKWKFGWVIPVPLGFVKGWMEIDGIRTEINGLGYHDQGWGNGPFHRVVDSWYWFHAQDKKNSLLVATYITSKKFGHKPVNLLMYFKDNKPVVITDKIKVTIDDFVYDHRAKRSYPRKLSVLLDNVKAKGKIELTCKEASDVIDLLDGVNPILAGMYRLFVGSPASFMLFPSIKGEISLQEDNTYPLKGLKTVCHIIYFR